MLNLIWVESVSKLSNYLGTRFLFMIFAIYNMWYFLTIIVYKIYPRKLINSEDLISVSCEEVKFQAGLQRESLHLHLEFWLNWVIVFCIDKQMGHYELISAYFFFVKFILVASLREGFKKKIKKFSNRLMNHFPNFWVKIPKFDNYQPPIVCYSRI